MMAAWGAVSYIIYRLGKRALDKKPIISPMVGSKCTATMPLTPKGYVRVGSELWQASSTGSTIAAGQEVTIVGTKGLTLLVAPLDEDNPKLSKTDDLD